MQTTAQKSGISVVGDLAWGSHFCHFYDSADDLRDSILAYFQAGLAARQRCLWVAPLPTRDARALLASSMSDLDRHLSTGQMEILDRESFSARAGNLEDLEDRALAVGYTGLRVAGHACVPGGAPKKRVVALCSYSLQGSEGQDVLQVVKKHDFAVIRREGIWEQIDNRAARTQELEAALSIRDQLMCVATHELKTPLASLKLYLEGLVRLMRRDDFDAEEGARRIGRALEQCERLDHLLNSLLDVARARSGSLEIHTALIDLPTVVRASCEHAAAFTARHNSQLVFNLPNELPCVTDPLRIDQVLSSLIGSMLKCAPGAPIFVSVGERGRDRVLISIRELGASALHGEESVESFGLGVWIARQLLESLAGTIGVSKIAGGGTEMTIELPRFVRMEAHG